MSKLARTKTPWITHDAFAFLKNAVKSGWAVFEWGAGGSTTFLLDTCRVVYTVEHNEAWLRLVRQIVDEFGLSAKWFPRYVPPLQTITPEVRSDRLLGCFKHYADQILDVGEQEFDLVFVDGRARSECLKRAVNKVRLGGYLGLDNSDRNYNVSCVPKTWIRKAFRGTGPESDSVVWETTFWQRT